MGTKPRATAKDDPLILPKAHVTVPHAPPTAHTRDDAVSTEYANKRAELDATLERLLLMPPARRHENGPFALEYERLAERRRVLADEVRALERALREQAAT